MIWKSPTVVGVIVAPVVIAVAAIVVVVVMHQRAEGAQQHDLSAREDAYVTALAAIHDVPAVDREAALAGGRNACFWVEEYGLDKTTLAGWQAYWAQPWEGRWLRLSVDLLCPPGS
jgi:hypothetical protein